MAPRAQHLAERVSEIEAGVFDEEMQKIKTMPDAELREMYNTRDIEPE
jgi:hypothetical protein